MSNENITQEEILHYAVIFWQYICVYIYSYFGLQNKTSSEKIYKNCD